MTDARDADLQSALAARYGDAPKHPLSSGNADLLCSMMTRGSCRDFTDRPVSPELLDLLCATALASPTKSDLQQRDIVLLHSASKRRQLADLVAGQAWVADAPMILVFCGNNRRQRLLHDWHKVPFANDHLDAFFNAVADAAIALGAFVTAAEAVGLGCCPISAVRNQARAVSDMLGLPDHVFPLAGLAVGHASRPPEVAMRLPLHVTCHVDEYQESDLREAINTYDRERAAVQPYARQRDPEVFGEKADYGWSDDKVRQYSKAERDGFGRYVRAQGFCLD